MGRPGGYVGDVRQPDSSLRERRTATLPEPVTRICIVALLLLARGTFAQDPAQPPAAVPSPADWRAEVDKACTSPRYGLRLAASKKIAQAGAAAVPAIRAFATDKSKDALPVALVEAIADGGGNDEAVLSLLEEWAKDREFFWRAQALKGLAVRSKDKAIAERCKQLFAAHENDAAWLVRVYARFGLNSVAATSHDRPAPGPESIDRAVEPSADPRAVVKLAALDLAHGFAPEPWILLAALGDERTFLGDPWGRRSAQEAFTALQAWLGDGCGYRVDASFADNRAAIAKLLQLVNAKYQKPIAAPTHLTDPAVAFSGGLEILSCRNGDLFLRWTADGRLHLGLTDDYAVVLPATAWQQLADSATRLDLEPQTGIVVCDRLRLQFDHDRGHGVIAPGALPAPVATWLEQLAAAIDAAGNYRLAAALRLRLQQFASH